MKRNIFVAFIIVVIVLVIVANIVEFKFIINSDVPNWIKWLILKG